MELFSQHLDYPPCGNRRHYKLQMPAPFQQLADRTLLTRRIQHMALHWRKLYPYLTLQPELVPPNMSKTGGKTVLDIPWTLQQRARAAEATIQRLEAWSQAADPTEPEASRTSLRSVISVDTNTM